jgi:alkylated DNA repair protein (DNA oxidative demethylase)
VDGLTYIDDFMTDDEERRVLGAIEPLDYRVVTMHGRTARRTVRMFGLDYDYSSHEVVPTDPLPDELHWLRDRAAALIDREPPDLAQILVSRYPPGAGIGWHRDAPMFGSKIVGVSLLAPARMRFQRTVKKGAAREREVHALELSPRSAYVLAGAARWSWQHTITPTKELRYSITFRTLRRERR